MATADSSPSRVLGIDIGTTAVKVAVQEGVGQVERASGAATFLGATINTAAYEDNDDRTIKEQNVGAIIQAVGTAIALLAGRGAFKTEAGAVAGVALAGQMHGVLTWSSADPVNSVSPLVTWEDQRGVADGAVAGLNRVLWAAGHRRAPVFPGYACSTLAQALAGGAASGRFAPGPGRHDQAGSIASYVACALVGGSTPFWSEPLLEATEAAAWGCFDPVGRQWDMGAAAALHPDLPALLPRIVTAGTVVGRVGAGGPSVHPTLSAALPKSLLGCPVTVGLGDHPASVVTTLARGRRQGSTGTNIALFNVGTSAQVAILGPLADGVASSPSSVLLPPGCEVRPFVEMPVPPAGTAAAHSAPAPPPAPAPAPAPCMLVCASMNGGSGLAAVHARLRSLSMAAGAAMGAEDTYGWLEKEGGKYLQALLHEEHPEGEGSASSSPPVSLPLVVTDLPIPERVPVGWGQEDGGASSSSAAAAAAASDASVASAASEGGPARMTLLQALAAMGYGKGKGELQPGLVYAAAAMAVAGKLLGTVPAPMASSLAHSLLAPVGSPGWVEVQASGGALTKSRVLRTALALHMVRLAREVGTLDSTASTAGTVSSLARLLEPAPGAAAVGEYAGALGTAAVTAAWLASPGPGGAGAGGKE